MGMEPAMNMTLLLAAIVITSGLSSMAQARCAVGVPCAMRVIAARKNA